MKILFSSVSLAVDDDDGGVVVVLAATPGRGMGGNGGTAAWVAVSLFLPALGSLLTPGPFRSFFR